MIAPGPRKFIEPRFHRMAVGDDQSDRQIGAQEKENQKPERKRDHDRLGERNWPDRIGQAFAAGP
jgi:hypothetical protein